MAYQKYYPNGWKSGEVGATPITPEALNNMENGIAAAVRTEDIVDNLTSTATNKPLSAKQGKVLEEHIAQSTANINVNTTQQGWGKTLTVNGLYALILVGGTLLLQTYVSGSATLTVSVLNYNGNVMFAKTSTDGVVEFSATSISGTGYKVQKSGNTLLITTPTDTVITAFAYHDT